MTILIILGITSICYSGKYHPGIKYIHPLPNSKLLPPGTTIILRLNDNLLSSITNLNMLIQVDGYSGLVFWSTDEKTIIFKSDNNFNRGDTIHVLVQSSQMGLDDFEFVFSIANIQSTKLPKKGQSIKTENVIQLSEAVSLPQIVNSVVLPNNFPKINTTIYGETAAGYLTFAAWGSTSRYLIMCDSDGNPYFYRQFDRIVGNVHLHFTDAHTEGVMTAHMGYNPSYYYLFNHNFEHIDTYEAGHGYETDDHECLVLANGHVLIIAEEIIPIDMSKLVANGKVNASVVGSHFQELDLNHNVIFEWRSWDHFDITDVVYTPASDTRVSVTGTFIDPVHMNSIELDYDGHYLISCKTLCELTKINHETGEIIWRLGGGKKNQFTFINDDIPIGYQHDIRPVPGKPNEYTIFDNGNNRHPNLFSRAVHVKLDTLNMTAEKIWEFRYNPDRYATVKGNCQILSNGNYYIDWSTNSTNTGIFGCEVTPDGEVVFEIHVPGVTTYRSHRYEWDVFCKTPELFIENYGETFRLIYNKFGDKNVKSYKVFYGTEPNPTTVLVTTDVPYVDLNATNFTSGIQYYFRIKSEDSIGIESDYSNEESTLISYYIPGQNMVHNGDFSLGFNFWEWQVDNNAVASRNINNEGQMKFTIINGGSEYDHVQANYPGLPLIWKHKYLFEFDAYADGNRLLEAEVRKTTSPYTNYSKMGLTSLTRQKKHFTYQFTMEDGSDNEACIVFNAGKSNSNVTIDNVVLKEVVESDVQRDVLEGVRSFQLDQNYPNPFNSSTSITYQIPEVSRIKLEVFDINGSLVKILRDEKQSVGFYQVTFDASQLASGVYFFRFFAASKKRQFNKISKMLFIK